MVVGGVASGFLRVLGSLGYSPRLPVFCLSVPLFIQPATCTSLFIHVVQVIYNVHVHAHVHVVMQVVCCGGIDG